MDDLQLDLEAAHRSFAKGCFNQAWTLLDLPERTPEEERALIALAYASLHHWTHVPEVTDREISVAYWLVSRAYTVIGNGAEAWAAAQVSLEHAHSLPPFYRGYAYEALARAAKLKGEPASAEIAKARALLAEIDDPEERALLESDLEGL